MAELLASVVAPRYAGPPPRASRHLARPQTNTPPEGGVVMRPASSA